LILGQARFGEVSFIIETKYKQYAFKNDAVTNTEKKTFLRICVESTSLEKRFINFGVKRE
jgi:hypothetical protein